MPTSIAGGFATEQPDSGALALRVFVFLITFSVNRIMAW